MRAGPSQPAAALLLAVASSLLLGQSCDPTEPTDTDGDGVVDWCDNCLLAANRSQIDTEGDDSGNTCDCDFNEDGHCNIDDFNAFLTDYGTGVDGGAGTDMNGDGRVDVDDFALFEPLFSAGHSGPGAIHAQAVDGTCLASGPSCTDPYREGTCFAHRLPAANGVAKPWHVHGKSDGCNLDAQLLVDAGFPAAAGNPNNPTDALLADQSGGAVRCPNAAFATFDSGRICDASQPCDPRDTGKLCGAPDGRGGVVSCGNTRAPAACEVLDICGSECGYRAYDCATQYRRNLIATCDALRGDERLVCRDACITFANLYADQVDNQPDPGPGVWSQEDLAKEQHACTCCPGPGPQGAPPAICGDGVCDAASESCQPSSCPADCGTCATGALCLTDSDCAAGRCSPTGHCELKSAGAACSAAADCTSGSCQAGTCQPVCGDGVCDGGELCGTSAPESCQADCGICPNDSTCLADNDCLTDTCSNNTCLGLAPNAPCTSSAECDSEICDFGACLDQPKGAGEPCGLDIACQAWQGTSIVPGRVGLCDLGFCTAGPKPAGAACERNEACEPLIDIGSFTKVGVCNVGVCLGEPVPVGTACNNDYACEQALCERIDTPAGAGLDCHGACNLGQCIADVLPIGAPCDSQLACGRHAFCADGACRKLALQSCSGSSECASGICDPGTHLCNSDCGDGICDVAGGEVCGQDDLLTCRSDCGECSLIDGLVRTVAPDVFCLGDEDCASGICNFGACLSGPNGPGTLCTTNSACWSGICNFGVCVERTRGVNSPCTTNEVCASGACNFGLCVAASSLPDGHPCTTGDVCQGGACNFGFCSSLLGDDSVCSTSDACLSGVCNLGLCEPPATTGEGLPCTNDDACESGYCAGLLYEPGKLPLPGLCAARCGDGQCGGLETCGYTNVLARCLDDCGQCPAGHTCLSRYDCTSGICDFGFCSDGQEANGSVCASNGVCASGICNFGFCIAGPQPAGTPCTTDAACFSGNCTAGFCIQKCGDNHCDGLEKCGDTNSGLECTRDCGLCGDGAVCISNSDCASGVCNIGFCIGGDLPAGSPCTTSLACRSGSCTAGLCIQRCGDASCDGTETCGSTNPLACTTDCGKCNDGTPCIGNADCNSGACSLGICASNLPNGTPCSTSAACASGNCLAGICAPKTFCGDLSCNGGETCSSCVVDCGTCCKLTGSSCSSGSQCCTGVCVSVPLDGKHCL